jgi:hypothetical protein
MDENIVLYLSKLVTYFLQQTNHFELCNKIRSIISNYPGYADVDTKKSTDKILLNFCQLKLTSIENGIERLKRKAFDGEKLQIALLMEEVRQACSNLNFIIHSINYCKSDFFIHKSIEADLITIYQYDIELIERIVCMEKIVLNNTSEVFMPSVLKQHFIGLEQVFTQRMDFIDKIS